MKSDNKNGRNIEARLYSLLRLPPLGAEGVDSERVLDRLRDAATSQPTSHRHVDEPIRAWRTPWRAAVICVAIAAAFVVALSPNIWRTPDTSTTKTLADGSRIELLAGAEAVVENVPDGLMVRLNSGSMMVFAAKQAVGRHLYVQTRDLKVAVVGTVFLVNADDKGSRVAVIEGEVRVQQGRVEKSLRPGEQLASNPKSPALEADRQLFRETGWSPEAYKSLAKLQESMAQSLAARQDSGRAASVSDKPKFEEASIRPCEKDLNATEGARGGGGGNGGTIRLTPGRLDVQCLTVNTLISLARPFLKNNPRQFPENGLLTMNGNPGFTPEDQTRVRSGPDWVRSERYAIAAVGDSTDAPTLQVPMLMDLIERRFNLKWHVETEEIPVYELSIAKGGLKIKPIEMDSGKYEEFRKIRAGLPPQRGRMFENVMLRDEPTYAGLLGCSYGPIPNPSVETARFREALRRDGKPPVCGFQSYVNGRLDPADARALGPNLVVNSGASPLSLLVASLNNDSGFRSLNPPYLRDTLNGLLVVDKTGLPDTNCLAAIPSAGTPCAPLFNYFLEYAIDESYFTTTAKEKNGSVPKAPNIFKALEKLGLQLEKTKARREFIVIEHIERPSEN